MEEGINLRDDMEKFNQLRKWLTVKEIRSLSPLQLAYIGDAVYELIVRTYLIKKGLPMKKIHKAAIEYVKAGAQSSFIYDLKDELTEKELDIIKRGRNAKTNTVPKNANVMDYRYATGFEALIGYLFLTGNDERLFWLSQRILM